MKHISILQIYKFDTVTKFRLINAFIVSIGMGLLSPVLISLKGSLLPIWVISMFSIINTLSVKTNAYFSKKSLNWLYRWGVVIHILFVLAAAIYFINPLVMIIIDSSLVIIEIAIFSAYGIKLNNYITDEYPSSMNNFQIVRNSVWADGTLIGLGVSALITSIFGISGMIIAFMTFNTFFSIWMLYNWKFYSNKNI